MERTRKRLWQAISVAALVVWVTCFVLYLETSNVAFGVPALIGQLFTFAGVFMTGRWRKRQREAAEPEPQD